MSNMQEVWKACYFSDFYDVSNFGNVRSWRAHSHKEKRSSQPRQLKTRINGGYEIFNARHDSKRMTYKIHRVMAKAFIPNPNKKPQINHINGIKSDNSLNNLEWCTASENQKHAVKNNLTTKKFGSDHWKSRLDDVQALVALTLIPFYSCGKISKEMGVSSTVIQNIRSGKTYSHLPTPIGKYQQHKSFQLDNSKRIPIIEKF